MDEMEELRQEFLSEANDLLSLMEEEVLKLEGDPTNRESVNSIFRVAHTLKGGASALEMDRIAVFTHNLENLLDLVRDEKLPVDEELIDIVLSSLDILKDLVLAAAERVEAKEGFEKETLEKIIQKAKSEKNVQTSSIQSQKKVESPKEEVSIATESHQDYSDPEEFETQSFHSEEEIPQQENASSGAVNLADLLVNNIGNDVNLVEAVLNEFNLNSEASEKIITEIKSGKNLYIVHIHLDPEYEMRSVSGIQTITGIRSLGELVAGNPSISQVMEEEFIENLHFLLLSVEKADKIYSKLYISDVTIEVDIENISELFGKEEEIELKENGLIKITKQVGFLDKVPEQELIPSIKEEIEVALQEGFFVYNVRIHINEDVPMRDVDSLLVLTTLEEVGEIISAIPTKRDLQADVYYPVLDIIFYTKESKENIRERCFMEDTTLEVRVSEFKLKEEKDSKTVDFKDLKETPSEKTPVKNESISSLLNVGRASSPTVNSQTNKSVVSNEIKEVQATEEINTPKPIVKSRLTSKEEIRILEKGVSSNSNANALKNFLKVDSTRVDSLLNMVSELVISKAALMELTGITGRRINEFKLALPDISNALVEVSVNQSGETLDEVKRLRTFIQEVSDTWHIMDVFDNTVNSVSRAINELQEGIMKIRMVPMGNVFNRFPRLVRDISKQLNKKIKLEITGEETELDKSIIEELADPLMHMIRNSLDHGIEMPEVRRQTGKNEEGTVTLRAIHEGTLIRIEIEDDGAGLDSERIRAKAIERGLITANHTLTKEEAYQLILQPGFSTAEKITDLSGRGVGMDVVKRNIEELSGTLSIDSEKGKGSKFIIKIPLTLSIIQGLTIRVEGYYYCIPINIVSETIPLNLSDLQHFERSEIIHLGDEIITVIDIKNIFNIRESRAKRLIRFKQDSSMGIDIEEYSHDINESLEMEVIQETQNSEEENLIGEIEAASNTIYSEEMLTQIQAESESQDKFLIIVNVGSKRIGILVDSIIAEQDIVIKSLNKDYALTKGISGATILGDGSISLILDVSQILELYLKKDELVAIN